MEKDNNRALSAHLCMLGACIMWGLMAPIGKDAMSSGVDGFSVVLFRVIGGALLFYIASLFGPKEKVSRKDKLLFACAAIFGIICNQCCFTIGLSITSPGNASIMTTSMPIFAMVLSFLILKEPITWKKLGGVLIGCAGALILILTSASAHDAKVGDIRGDLLCLGAQCSYALYLSLFNPLIRRHSPLTVNKWMFLWAAVILTPFLGIHTITSIQWADVAGQTWWDVAYVVFFGTFVSYLLCINGQRTLRPTVVSIYNYVQPLVSVTVSVLCGLGMFKWSQGVAVVLVFTGVWMVTKSKSKHDIQARR